MARHPKWLAGGLALASLLSAFAEDTEEERYMRRLVKAADKLSALIKCIEELQMGNNEFKKAKEECEKYLIELDMPEVGIFIRDFLPSYSLSLDEQNIAL